MTRANTEHDEALNAATFRGCEFLGTESIHGPKHGDPRDLAKIEGTARRETRVATSTRRSFR